MRAENGRCGMWLKTKYKLINLAQVAYIELSADQKVVWAIFPNGEDATIYRGPEAAKVYDRLAEHFSIDGLITPARFGIEEGGQS